jgi:hypothetical protein
MNRPALRSQSPRRRRLSLQCHRSAGCSGRLHRLPPLQASRRLLLVHPRCWRRRRLLRSASFRTPLRTSRAWRGGALCRSTAGAGTWKAATDSVAQATRTSRQFGGVEVMSAMLVRLDEGQTTAGQPQSRSVCVSYRCATTRVLSRRTPLVPKPSSFARACEISSERPRMNGPRSRMTT